MFHRRFAGAALTVLILVGLLVAGGSAIHRSGWTQGYMMGRLSAGDEAAVPFMPYGYPGRGFGLSHSLCCVGPLLTIGLLFLLLIMAGKFFRFRAWKLADGPKGKDWAKHWHRHHGTKPPWHWWGWDESSEEESEAAAPEAETGDAEAEA